MRASTRRLADHEDPGLMKDAVIPDSGLQMMALHVTRLVSAGDCVHQRPGIVHFLFDYSPDMEYLEIVGPADFGSIPVPGPCEVPPVTPWPTAN